MNPPSTTRRNFLRATGVTMALPWMETFARTAAVPPRRFVGINVPLGFLSEHFFPKDSGFDYALSSYLEPAADLKKHFTVISGTSHPGVDGGHSAEKTFLTAAPHPGSRSFKNSISLDQVMAPELGTETRFASLSLGSSLSWSANGVSIPAEDNPAHAWQRLFLQGTPKEIEQQKHRIGDGQSILDTVMDEARSMERKISRADSEKLDQYFTAIRESEKRLLREKQWVDTPKPTVEEPVFERNAFLDQLGRIRCLYDVTRLALATDSTRIVTLGAFNNSNVIPIPGVDMGYHALTHHGMNPEMIKQLELIDREMIKLWVEFITKLRDSEEGGTNLLDQAQVFLGSNLGNANAHTNFNLPVLLAGGGWKHGQHLAFDEKNNEELPKLFVSMMQQMGMENVQTFASSRGTLPGLDAA